jgi:hypothetical protein
VIARGSKEIRGNFQWNEDRSERKLTDGKVSESATATERINLDCDREDEESHHQRRKIISG